MGTEASQKNITAGRAVRDQHQLQKFNDRRRQQGWHMQQ